MRRVFQVGFIFALMVLGLAACGGGTQPTTPTTTSNDDQNAPAEESDAVRRPQFLNAYADW
ncbi:MAG: hypothetical protein RLP44_06220 [Aggregatilineales bacterium]